MDTLKEKNAKICICFLLQNHSRDFFSYLKQDSALWISNNDGKKSNKFFLTIFVHFN